MLHDVTERNITIWFVCHHTLFTVCLFHKQVSFSPGWTAACSRMSLLGNCCLCLQKLQDWDLLWNSNTEQCPGVEWYLLVHAMLSYTNQVKRSQSGCLGSYLSFMKIKLASHKNHESRKDSSAFFMQIWVIKKGHLYKIFGPPLSLKGLIKHLKNKTNLKQMILAPFTQTVNKT